LDAGAQEMDDRSDDVPKRSAAQHHKVQDTVVDTCPRQVDSDTASQPRSINDRNLKWRLLYRDLLAINL
jgi:hypothetical protein